MSTIGAIGGYGYQRSAVWGQTYYALGMGVARSAASNPSQPETPVEPVQPVKAVRGDAAVRITMPVALPTEQDLNNAGENMVRMRIQYGGQEAQFRMGAHGLEVNAAQGESLRASGLEPEDDEKETTDPITHFEPMEQVRKTECQTCARRKYQDVSDDPGVSFKTPTTLTPEEAPAAVRGHEQEHVVRERAEAEREGRKVVSQSVMIHTEVCPECGRVYVSGGTTRTVTMEDNTEELLRELRKRGHTVGGLRLDDVLEAA